MRIKKCRLIAAFCISMAIYLNLDKNLFKSSGKGALNA